MVTVCSSVQLTPLLVKLATSWFALTTCVLLWACLGMTSKVVLTLLPKWAATTSDLVDTKVKLAGLRARFFIGLAFLGEALYCTCSHQLFTDAVPVQANWRTSRSYL